MEYIRIKNIRILLKSEESYCLTPCSFLIDKGSHSIYKIIFDQHLDGAIDFHNDIFLPRLFNIHCHLGEAGFSHISGNDWTITKYLDYTNSFNNQLSTSESDKVWSKSAKETIADCVKYGVGGVCAGRAANALIQTNINCMSGYPLMNTKKLERFQAGGIDGFKSYIQEYNSRNCNVGILMHSLYANNPETLQFVKKCMDIGAGFFALHLSEDITTRFKETQICKMKPTMCLDENGLLTDKTIIVHGALVDDSELELISKRKATIVICPISNLFLNTKIPDIDKLNDYDINWCLATDGPATGRTMSLFEQANTLLSAYPNTKIEDVWESITLTPARLYNRRCYTGMISEGSESVGLRIKMKGDSFKALLYNLIKGKVGFETVDLTSFEE